MCIGGDSRVAWLKSFTDRWPMLPRSGDRISFPPPPGGPTSRWILPTLVSMASVDSQSVDIALKFVKSMHAGYQDEGASILMRRSQESAGGSRDCDERPRWRQRERERDPITCKFPLRCFQNASIHVPSAPTTHDTVCLLALFETIQHVFNS